MSTAPPAAWSTSRLFGCEATVPAEARAFVRDELIDQPVHAGVVDDAVLVVSELATNAVIAARSRVEVEVSVEESVVRIGVSDDGGGWPQQMDPGSQDEHGRGLMIVAALATEWGIDSVAGTGKRVWAALPVHPRDAPVQ